jgi:2-oxoisovalerate dehydrogenase E1 component beta subunit
MARMTMIEAIRSALDVSMGRDDNVVVYGEDVGYFGGVFRCTHGLQQKYGVNRCFDAPISELGIVGTAIGMAAYGLRPCVEIQFADYMYPAYDQIVSEAARLRYRSAGDFTCPMVIRMPTGGGIFGGQTHSQSPEALFTHVAGLKTVVPSNPRDAKGLLIAAIEDPDPVIFLEPKRLYNGPFDGHHDRPVTPWSKHELGEVEEGHYTIPLGKAAIRREGSAVTIVTYGTMVHVAQAATEETGIDAEIIDLRTLVPLDLDAIVASVSKTGRCIVLHEATLTSGFGAELAALVQQHCFYHLEAPVLRVTGWDTPYPHSAGMGLFPRPQPRRRRPARDHGEPLMAERIIKLPDVGEGIAEAELVEWHVKVGDIVREDDLIAAVMTDKATVEIPSPVEGEVTWVGAEIGDTVAIGSALVKLKVAGGAGDRAAGRSRSRSARRAVTGKARCRGACHTGTGARLRARPQAIADAQARCGSGPPGADRRRSRSAPPGRREAAGLARRPAEGARGRDRPTPGPGLGSGWPDQP